jgi:anti-sigma regulatory factor (Ser/Thr protein kinase)
MHDTDLNLARIRGQWRAKSMMGVYKAARESVTPMPPTGTRAGNPAGGHAGMAGAVLGTLTIPGRPEHVHEARAFVAKALGELHPSLDTAVLLTSEIVTNAVTHSRSRYPTGTVRVVITESGGGLRFDIGDDGSEISSPVVRGEVLGTDGHGLFLVQALASQWGYVRAERGTTVWFWLAPMAQAHSAA